MFQMIKPLVLTVQLPPKFFFLHVIIIIIRNTYIAPNPVINCSQALSSQYNSSLKSLTEQMRLQMFFEDVDTLGGLDIHGDGIP